MGILKKIIPTITGIITGIFIWDLQTHKNLINLILLPLISCIVFNFFWVFYSRIILKKGAKTLEKDAMTFTPFLILMFFPLRHVINLDSKYMQFGNLPSAILLIFSISAFLFLKVLFYKCQIKDLENDKLIYLVIIAYFVLFSTLSILKHEAFFSTAFDLAIYDQIVWGYKNLDMAYSIGRTYTHFVGGHVEPILFVISLFYLIYSSPITLLITQTAMIALGALPIYLLSKKVLNNRLASISLSAAYLLYPSIQFPNLFDFHPLVLAVPFILFSFYFLEVRNYKAVVVFLFLAGLSKEYTVLVLIPLGIYIFLMHKKRVLGAFIALGGLIWFIINIKVIIPHFFGGGYFYLSTNTYFGLTFSEAIKTLITKPIYVAKYLLVLNKFAFLVLLLTPMAFGIFAFLAPEFLLLGVTEFAILFLYTPNSLSEIVYHHQVLSIPFIIVATIYGIKRFNKFNKNWKIIPKKNVLPAVSILLISTALLANISYGPFAILYDLRDFNPYSNYAKTGHKFVSMIPKEASVAASEWVLPHLSQRENAYSLKRILKTDKNFFESGELDYPEYILIDLSAAMIDPKRSALKVDSNMLSDMFSNNMYGIIASEGTWILLKKGENYEQNLCKILPYLNKEAYPYLKINIEDEESIKKCWQER